MFAGSAFSILLQVHLKGVKGHCAFVRLQSLQIGTENICSAINAPLHSVKLRECKDTYLSKCRKALIVRHPFSNEARWIDKLLNDCALLSAFW